MWISVSFALLAIGGVLIFYPIESLSYFTYPFLMWGVIGLFDFLNQKRWGESLIKNNPKKFWGNIVPLSIIFWLFFEFGNLLYVQWEYLNVPSNKPTAVFLTILSFGTVIPFVVEVIWLLQGPVKSFPVPLKKKMSSFYSLVLPFVGFLLLFLYILDPSFLMAQTIWIAPFLFLLPFMPLQKASFIKAKRFTLYLIGGILLSGFVWEVLNFWAKTKWHYLIFPNALRVFEMPVIGYLGYIPFVFSLIAVYLFINRFFAPTRINIVIFYILAILLSYFFVLLYFRSFHV